MGDFALSYNSPAELVQQYDVYGNPIVRPSRKHHQKQPKAPVPPSNVRAEPEPSLVPTTFGAVLPMLTALGNPYPTELRAQQVGPRVVRAVIDRIDAALAGGKIKLGGGTLDAGGKAHLKRHLLEQIFPELYGDPLPYDVVAVKQIDSRKATRLLDDRLQAVFAEGRVKLPGVVLNSRDCLDLQELLQVEILKEEYSTGLAASQSDVGSWLGDDDSEPDPTEPEVSHA